MTRKKLPPKVTWTQREVLRAMDDGKTLVLENSTHSVIDRCIWPSWPTVDALVRLGLIEQLEPEVKRDGGWVRRVFPYRRVPGTEYR